MKKVLAVLLVFIMGISFFSCSGFNQGRSIKSAFTKQEEVKFILKKSLQRRIFLNECEKFIDDFKVVMNDVKGIVIFILSDFVNLKMIE